MPSKRPRRAQPTLDERKSKLASDLLADLERLRGQLFKPVVEKKAVVVSDGRESGSHVEIVDIRLPQPSFEAKKTIVTAIAVGLEKVLQLDDAALPQGDAVDDLAARRAARRAGAKPDDAAAGGGVERGGRGGRSR